MKKYIYAVMALMTTGCSSIPTCPSTQSYVKVTSPNNELDISLNPIVQQGNFKIKHGGKYAEGCMPLGKCTGTVKVSSEGYECQVTTNETATN